MNRYQAQQNSTSKHLQNNEKTKYSRRNPSPPPPPVFASLLSRWTKTGRWNTLRYHVKNYWIHFFRLVRLWFSLFVLIISCFFCLSLGDQLFLSFCLGNKLFLYVLVISCLSLFWCSAGKQKNGYGNTFKHYFKNNRSLPFWSQFRVWFSLCFDNQLVFFSPCWFSAAKTREWINTTPKKTWISLFWGSISCLILFVLVLVSCAVEKSDGLFTLGGGGKNGVSKQATPAKPPHLLATLCKVLRSAIRLSHISTRSLCHTTHPSHADRHTFLAVPRATSPFSSVWLHPCHTSTRRTSQPHY